MNIYIGLTIAVAAATFEKRLNTFHWLMFVAAWPAIIAIEFYEAEADRMRKNHDRVTKK